MRLRCTTWFVWACLAGFPAHARAQAVVASWIQLGPGSSPAALAAGRYGDQPASTTPTILARAVVSDGVCPGISLDGGSASPMQKRFSARALSELPGKPAYFVDPTQTDPATFPDGTAKATPDWAECEAVVPAGHRRAAIGGTSLKLPVANPKRILVVGDTGCRNFRQSCSNPMAFPSAYLAGAEASFSPDLIVHVGDWLYREKPGLVAAEAWGDTFDGWNADVFYPMKALLQSAPIVMTRGNHESCGRGARGWYALLDPLPFDPAKVACTPTAHYPPPSGGGPAYTADFEPSYVVTAQNIDFIVHDSSFAQDTALDPALAQSYDLDLTRVLAALPKGSIAVFVTHRPSFGLIAQKGTPGAAQNVGNMTEQAVFSGGTSVASAFVHGVPTSIGLFLSGHVHQAQYVNLQDSAYYAPQLIVGMSGTLLDPDINTGAVPTGNVDGPSFTEKSARFPIDHFDGKMGATTAAAAGAHDEFGFAVLDTVNNSQGAINGFTADVYKLGTAKAGTCRIALVPRGIGCDF